MQKKTDSEIEQWVLREIGSEKTMRSREICVQSHDGVVRLCGSVPSYANKQTAELAALRVDGVTGLVNDIQFKPLCAATSKTSAAIMPSAQANRYPLFTPRASENQVAKATAPVGRG